MNHITCNTLTSLKKLVVKRKRLTTKWMTCYRKFWRWLLEVEWVAVASRFDGPRESCASSDCLAARRPSFQNWKAWRLPRFSRGRRRRRCFFPEMCLASKVNWLIWSSWWDWREVQLSLFWLKTKIRDLWLVKMKMVLVSTICWKYLTALCIASNYPFIKTMWRGEAQLLIDGWQMSSRSMVLNSFFAAKKRSAAKRRGFAATGGSSVVRIWCAVFWSGSDVFGAPWRVITGRPGKPWISLGCLWYFCPLDPFPLV